MYNTYQTGFYYQRLPSTLYVKNWENNKNRGSKKKKYETRMNIMDFTAVNVDKVHISVVVKYKNPL